MLTVDRVATLIGKPFDRRVIETVVGFGGSELPSDHDPGHPEDECHYFMVPPNGLQFAAGPDRIITTIFFMLDGDSNVRGHPWKLENGVGSASARSDVRARLGEPEKSGGPTTVRGLPPVGAWDRFTFPPFGYLHVQYAVDQDRISQFTVMATAP